jgi:hypothetical protein
LERHAPALAQAVEFPRVTGRQRLNTFGLRLELMIYIKISGKNEICRWLAKFLIYINFLRCMSKVSFA